MEHGDVAAAWQRYLEAAVRLKLQGNVLCAFNCNVDVVVRLDSPSLRSLIDGSPGLDWERVRSIRADELTSIDTREEFVAVLADRMASGKSLLIVGHPEVFAWLRERIMEREEKVGGQAGIMANQMVALGADCVLYSPILSPEQVQVLLEPVRVPEVAHGRLALTPVRGAARPGDPTRSPWVFEYAKGVAFDFRFTQLTTPRANRLILTTRIPGLGMGFLPEFLPYTPELGEAADLAMLAGYHLGGPDPDDRACLRQYFVESGEAIRLLRQNNPRLRMHFEYCPMKEVDMEVEMLRRVVSEVDSFGINETEICQVLERLGEPRLAAEIRENERAYVLYEAALFLLRELGVERVHVHNLGYFVLALREPYHTTPEHVRQAALYGTSVNACRALHGGYARAHEVAEAARLPLSDVGVEQLHSFATEAGQKAPQAQGLAEFVNTGILRFADHTVVVVPTHIVPNPVITVGMGDTISSASYAAELIGH